MAPITMAAMIDPMTTRPTINAMSQRVPWGKSVSIDLFDCNRTTLSDPQIIKDFIIGVIKSIGMQAHGPTHIDRFGDPQCGLEGWSAMQFIETSSITLHADEMGNRCFIDIFSCKDFDASKACHFAKTCFQSKSEKISTLSR